MKQDPDQVAHRDVDTKTGKMLDDTKEAISQLTDRGAEVVEDVRDTAQEYAHDIRDTARVYVDAARDAGHRKAEEAAFYAELGYEEARDWSRQRPGQALAIAAGVGFLAGLLLARR